VSVTFSKESDTLCALLDGEIDHHTASTMREAIDANVKKLMPKTLFLDFSGISFMDSSGIGLVMGRYKLMKEHGGEVKVINTPPAINRVMRLAGLEKLKVM